MRGFMAERRHVAGGIAKRLERRHLDVVSDGRVVGLAAAMPDDRAGVGEEAIGLLDALDRIEDRRRPVMIMVGQAVDLLDVEDGVGLEERDFPIDLAAIADRSRSW